MLIAGTGKGHDRNGLYIIGSALLAIGTTLLAGCAPSVAKVPPTSTLPEPVNGVIPRGEAILLRQSGSGPADTRQFTVTDATWDLSWRDNCSDINRKGKFLLKVTGYGPASSNTGTGNSYDVARTWWVVQHIRESGTYNLSMSTKCKWTVYALQP